MNRENLIFVLSGLLMSSLPVIAQDVDPLAIREQILLQENKRYIQMAQHDNVISSTQADSLRRITNSSAEKPSRIGIDILFRIRDYIDHEYEEQMRDVNEPVVEEYYYAPNKMLPDKLCIPDDIVFPEVLEEERQRIAIEQLAESLARDLEKEKLPRWQQWWIDYVRIFFGSRDWYKRRVIFINGHEMPTPAGDPRDGR